MALGLLPSSVAGAEPRVLLGHVVHGGEQDRLDLGFPERQQETLDAHVPVLRDPLRVPAADVRRQVHGQRVRGVGEADRVRVRQDGYLGHGGEHGADDQGHRLPVVILHVEDGRLPQGDVPLLQRGLREGVRQTVEIALVKIRVRIRYCDYDVGGVPASVADMIAQPLEGPSHVARLPSRVVGQVGRVQSHGNLPEGVPVFVLQPLGLLCGALLAGLHGEQHADLAPGNRALTYRVDSLAKDVEVLLVVGEDHPMDHRLGVGSLDRVQGGPWRHAHLLSHLPQSERAVEDHVDPVGEHHHGRDQHEQRVDLLRVRVGHHGQHDRGAEHHQCRD
mmetsp:Transcript_11343/g.30216  ORF Transcript_11343/g.30216 Transcript_11343/m.30216 type:complete len:333 (-) Transcript_11343:1069-2067(-)